MADPQSSGKGFVTVAEMAELCQLSRSRFYDLMRAGAFPKPVRHPSSKRPIFDRQLMEQCLEIRQTGIGANGLPVLFNRKKKGPPKPPRKPAPEKPPDHADLLSALKGLGLNSTPQAVADALAQLFPTGYAGLDQGEVIRKVFLHLQRGKILGP
jgi:hypothetical protein